MGDERKEKIMTGAWRTFALTALAAAVWAVVCPQPGPAQGTASDVLQIDIENFVRYFEDSSDFSKFATDASVTTATAPKNFGLSLFIGDIVAVNGQPAKGTLTIHGRAITLRPSPSPGSAIADTNRNAIADFTFEILDAASTPVGTIMGFGLTVGSPPPGAPSGQIQGNNAIVGGTGAYFGARGSFGDGIAPQPLAIRVASMSEDPANRRQNGGGRARFLLHVIPITRPQIMAVSRANDLSLVTAANPARTGEVLTLWVTGLGPTRPGVDPGTPFPASLLAVVNSPVELTVNGAPAEVLYAGGFPGVVDGYQVNARLPTGITRGSASLQIRVAWMAGPEAKIAIQ